jgi:hypothetical protein
MADFLLNIVAQSMGSMESVQPLIAPLFAPPSLPALESVPQPIDVASMPLPAPQFAPVLEASSLNVLATLPTLVPLPTPDQPEPFFDALLEGTLVPSDDTVAEYTNTSRGVGLPRPKEQHIEAYTDQVHAPTAFNPISLQGMQNSILPFFESTETEITELATYDHEQINDAPIRRRSDMHHLTPNRRRSDMHHLTPNRRRNDMHHLTPNVQRNDMHHLTPNRRRNDMHQLTSNAQPIQSFEQEYDRQAHSPETPMTSPPAISTSRVNPEHLPFPEGWPIKSTDNPPTRVGARLIAPHAGTSLDAPVTESPFAPPPDSVEAIHPVHTGASPTRVGARLIAPHADTSQDAPVTESPLAPPPGPVGRDKSVPTPGIPALEALVQQQIVHHHAVQLTQEAALFDQSHDQPETTIVPAPIKSDMKGPVRQLQTNLQQSGLGTGQAAWQQAERQHSSIPQETVEDQPAPIIRVSIWRIEVRASIPATRSEPTRAVEPVPALSLSEYLSQRRGGLP